MEIYSVQEFLNIIESLKDNYTYTCRSVNSKIIPPQTLTPRFIFRGHSSLEYKLLPSIFREETTNFSGRTTKYSQLEFNILSDFISEANRFAKGIQSDNYIAWLEIAQHFGVPTRLLDFTENPLVALYFACENISSNDAAVCVLNVPSYNKKFYSDNSYFVLSNLSKQKVKYIVDSEIVYQDFQTQHYNNPSYLQFPWIYKPCYIEERMTLQSSIFMLWAAQKSDLEYFMEEKNFLLFDENVNNKEDGILGKIIIPHNIKKHIIEQLNLLGVNEKSIYPGLDGIGKYIKTKYSFDSPYV